MEKKLIFSRIIKNENNKNWDWSGTGTALYKGLGKRVEILDCYFVWDLKIWLRKILVKLKLINDDLSLYEIKRAEQKVDFNKIGHFPVFQFDEFPMNNNAGNYIYQDLSVLYLNDIASNNKELFKFSGFQSNNLNAIQNRAKNQYEFYTKCNKIFTMGKWLKKYLEENTNIETSKIVHVGGGINIDYKLIDYSQKQGNKILFVGKDFERKGGPLVLKAFDYLSKFIDSNVEIYIIGPKKLNYEIKNDKIKFIGEISAQELYRYFNMCDIFCMPSNFEAYGLVFIEALTFGLPCIGRNLFEMPYFIEEGKTGLLIDDDDHVKLAKKMDYLLKNDEIKNNVIKNRDFYISEYSWDNVCDRILENIEF